jgi:nitrite reductase/ring-hydroxylating ferredoxin subunit
MLMNNWYVAAESKDVAVGQPLGVRMLGFDFALHRLPDGTVVCLSDVCIHRGASLSRGKCIDGAIACPFHGWQFDAGGACVKIPSMGADQPIPKRAKIDSYPTAEVYDWVWVFLGDLPEDKRPAPPRLLPEYEQTDKWRTTRMVVDVPANWQKLEENSLDTAHLAFVHATFGSRLDPRAVSVPIVRTPYGAKLKREKPAPRASQKTGVLGALLSEEREKTTVELEFSVLGVCHRINPTFRPGISQVTFSASTPVDAKTTRQFGLQARNYAIEPEHDAERLSGRRNAINEDIAVISHVRPALGPTPFREELLVRADEMESTFRHLVYRMIDAGWELDHEKVASAWDRKVYVIPSPARRLDPTGWVHEAAPTTKPRTDDGWDALLRDAATASGVAAE